MPSESSSFHKSSVSLPLSSVELTSAAEREIAAFIRVVTELFGSEQAKLSAEDWIDELLSIDDLSISALSDWRAVTVGASVRLANRLAHNAGIANTIVQ